MEQILDIALRALSAGVNDPTTAVHALGHLSAITARTVRMPRLPAGLSSESGRLAVVTVTQDAADDVYAALSPIRHYCTDHPAVVTRFVQVVDELASLCEDPAVRTALVAELDALSDQLRLRTDDPATTRDLLARTAEIRQRIAVGAPG